MKICNIVIAISSFLIFNTLSFDVHGGATPPTTSTPVESAITVDLCGSAAMSCGDGTCSILCETNSTCPQDCYCGNGVCHPASENSSTCPQDCGCNKNTKYDGDSMPNITNLCGTSEGIGGVDGDISLARKINSMYVCKIDDAYLNGLNSKDCAPDTTIFGDPIHFRYSCVSSSPITSMSCGPNYVVSYSQFASTPCPYTNSITPYYYICDLPMEISSPCTAPNRTMYPVESLSSSAPMGALGFCCAVLGDVYVATPKCKDLTQEQMSSGMACLDIP